MSPVLEKTRQGNGECRDEDLKSRVTVVGSGNWGSVAAKLIASNALKLPSFHGKKRFFVYSDSFCSCKLKILGYDDLGLCHYNLNTGFCL